MKKSEESIACLRCKKDTVVKYGRDANGVQRYKCECGETFNENSLKDSQNHKKKRIAAHLLLFGYKHSTIARKLNITQNDVDSWQHKYLPKLDSLDNERPGRLMDINIVYQHVAEIESGKLNKKDPKSKKQGPKKSTRKK